MNKQEFLSQLRARLESLPQNEAEERLVFYEEMIADRMEEGASEEDAVSAVGTVDEIFERIVEETPLTAIVKEKLRPKRKIGAWVIVLLVLGFPVWFSVLASLFAVAFSVYASLWAVVVSFWAIEVSFWGTALGALAGGIGLAILGHLSAGLATVGAALVTAGLSVFGFYGCKMATKGMAWLTRKMLFVVKKGFVGKEKTV